MALPVQAPASSALRDPDFIGIVEKWIDEAPKETGLKTHGFEGKDPAPRFQRRAVVRIVGGAAAIDPKDAGDLLDEQAPIVGSAKQWAAADATKVEVYLGQKSGKFYYNPMLAEASSDPKALKRVAAA